MTAVVGGALALAGLAIFITRHGIGNGVALIFAATVLLDLPHALLVMVRDIVQRERVGSAYLVTAVVTVAMVAACVAVLRGRRKIALERVPREEDMIPDEDAEENAEEEPEDDDVEDGTEPPEVEPRWMVVAVFDTEIEAELLVAELSRASIEAVVLANRWMSAIGSLSLWGPCRPAYPALAPHRRLAEGAVKVYVREADAERARALIPARVVSG